MKIAALLVGVSRLADPGIHELQYAHRDAIALHAVFADGNLELGATADQCLLVTDENATAEAVRAALNELVRVANSDRTDLVAVHFACHGTPSGTLVLHDTDRADADNSGLPLAELMTTITAIQNKPVLVTLDCCFAGTALGMTDSPNRAAFSDLMHGFQNQSRLVGCGAEYGQKAYEDTRLGMGLFSHSMVEEVRARHAAGAREVNVSDWMSATNRRTGELAQARGRTQTPVAFATVRGATMTLRIARERPYQTRLIVPTDLSGVTQNPASLVPHGLDAATVQAICARLGGSPRLNKLQQRSVYEGGVLRGRSVFVRAPTSAGKTLVAELAILGQQGSGRKTVVLLPLRALAREHASTFRRAYGALGIRVIVSTGDARDEDDLLLRGQFEVAFLTYENFCALISARPDLKETIGLVVVDELQSIADDGRGHTLELLMVQIRRWGQESQWPQVVVLCGELADLTELQRWLGYEVVASSERPIPLEESVVRVATGEVRLRDSTSGVERRENWPDVVVALSENDDRARRRQAAVPIIRRLVGLGQQVVVFCSEKRQARLMASRLAQDCGLGPARELASKISNLDATTNHRTRELLSKIVANGVGLHVADLTDDERNAVEDAFRSRELRLLVATTTLGQGVNLPADSVVFVDTTRWNGSESVPITTASYRNIAGRAGRLIPGGPPRGLSVLVAQSQSAETTYWREYVTSAPERLGSTLGELSAEDRTMLLLRQFESASANMLTDALAGTYWATSERVTTQWRRARRAEIESALGTLGAAGLVTSSSDTEWKLTPVGAAAAGYGVSWKSAQSISRGATAIASAGVQPDAVALTVLSLLTTELTGCRCPWGTATSVPGEIPPAFASRPALWSLLISDGENPQEPGDRLHKLNALTQWLSGSPLRDVEGFFARGAKDDVVVGLFMSVVNRLTAVLPAVAAITRLSFPAAGAMLGEESRRLIGQLGIGGGRHVASLHRLRLALSRGECLALVRMGIRSLDSLRQAVEEREADLAAVLSTPGLQRLKTLLDDRRHRSRITAPQPQLTLEGFD